MESSEFVHIQSPLRTMTMDSPPLWDESISLCARGLYATLCTRLKSNVEVSVDAIARTCGSTMYMVRKAIDELKRAGYLAIERVRDSAGRLTNRSIWTLTPNANGLQGELANMSAEQSRRRYLEITSRTHRSPKYDIREQAVGIHAENHETPGQSLNPIYANRSCAETQNPRSIPKSDIPHLAPFNYNVNDIPVNPFNPEGFHPVHVESFDNERRKDNDGNGVNVEVLVGGRRGKLSKKLKEVEGYVPRNCTMEQAVEVYEIIRSACSEKRFYDDQLALTLPMIDRLFDGNERWKAQVPLSVRFYAGNFFGRKLPSYWLKDFWSEVLEHVKASHVTLRLPSEQPSKEEEEAKRRAVLERIRKFSPLTCGVAAC